MTDAEDERVAFRFGLDQLIAGGAAERFEILDGARIGGLDDEDLSARDVFEGFLGAEDGEGAVEVAGIKNVFSHGILPMLVRGANRMQEKGSAAFSSSGSSADQIVSHQVNSPHQMKRLISDWEAVSI
jgi:hypothetical protein